MRRRNRFDPAQAAASAIQGGLEGFRAGRRDALLERRVRQDEARYEAAQNAALEQQARVEAARESVISLARQGAERRRASLQEAVDLGKLHADRARQRVLQTQTELQAFVAQARAMDPSQSGAARLLMEQALSFQKTKLIAGEFADAAAYSENVERELAQWNPGAADMLKEARERMANGEAMPEEVRRLTDQVLRMQAQEEVALERQAIGIQRATQQIDQEGLSEGQRDAMREVRSMWKNGLYRVMSLDELMAELRAANAMGDSEYGRLHREVLRDRMTSEKQSRMDPGESQPQPQTQNGSVPYSQLPAETKLEYIRALREMQQETAASGPQK